MSTSKIAPVSSGQGNNGTLLNFSTSSRVSGKLGQTLTFNGIDQTVSIPHSPSIKPVTTMIISAWVKPTATILNDYREI